MNTKQLVLAISFMSAISGAYAQQNDMLGNSGFTGPNPLAPTTANVAGKTRAEVKAELKQAQDSGMTDSVAFVGAHPASDVQANVPGKTRAQVLAELKQSQQQGAVDHVGFVDAPAATVKPVSTQVQLSSH